MLSVASVSSAGGAGNYFAKDDYYVGEGPSALSEWGGKGAEAQGLAGEGPSSTITSTVSAEPMRLFRCPSQPVFSPSSAATKGFSLPTFQL